MWEQDGRDLHNQVTAGKVSGFPHPGNDVTPGKPCTHLSCQSAGQPATLSSIIVKYLLWDTHHASGWLGEGE